MSKIPDKFYAGDTLEWTESHSDYPATDGWKIRYALHRNDGVGINIQSVASGSDHLFSISANTSKFYEAGTYRFQRFAVKGEGADTVRNTIDSGAVEVILDLETAGEVESRSFNRRMVEDLEKVLEKFAKSDAKQFTINGRTYIKDDIKSYVRTYNEFKQRLIDEERKEQGKPTQKLRLARFDNA